MTRLDYPLNSSQTGTLPVITVVVFDWPIFFGSGVTEYKHRFPNAGFGSLEFSAREIGILCLLLLRGPQTLGELRSRSSLLCQFGGVSGSEAILQGPVDRSGGPFVVRSAR